MTTAIQTNDKLGDYDRFLRDKAQLATAAGFLDVSPDEVNPILKPHQRDAVVWAVRGGRRALFESFGLGKTMQQLEILRLVLDRLGGGRGLIVCPLGVRQEFVRDARLLDLDPQFIRDAGEASADGIYLTNYETVRDGKLDPRAFEVVSLDEAAVLRGFGGTKTFREFMRLYEGTANYRFVATATPSPNEYLELLAYAAFLDILDVGQAKTRFFKRDSEHADRLTLLPHMEHEFWMWIASWALFLQRPSDLGYSDDGYELPPIEVVWHQVPAAARGAVKFDRDGRGELFRDASMGVQAAAAEKRLSIPQRVEKMREIVDEAPDEHFLLWHDLEDERRAITAAVPDAVSVWGAQDLDERERTITAFSDGRIPYLSTKPVIAGSGCNFQRHCHRAIFTGIGFKFSDFVQAIHRIQRFQQTKPVRIDLIYTEAEAEIRKRLEEKWRGHERLVARMSEIIREHGLSHEAIGGGLRRSVGVERQERAGDGYRLILNDSVLETREMETGSVDLIVTSIPFSTQYEYSPSYNDFGHNEHNQAFWRQMDFLTPELVRVLQHGRLAAIHVKDRIVPGGINGLGFRTLHPFHAEALAHYMGHGLAFLGMITVVTDVVRENNQTYRLGWTEQCKDGSPMGVGVPEYVLLLRKPPTDLSNGYADEPIVKDKGEYSLGRWQVDAHGFWRSSGNRHLLPEEFAGLTHPEMFRLFRDHNLEHPYTYEDHIGLNDHLRAEGKLPVDFMLLQPPSWHPDVWTDVARMRTLNMIQAQKGKEQHLCLARGSQVLTRERGYVPIQEVQVGEHAFTHRGRWRPVLVARRTGVRHAITVRAHGVPGVTLTPDHKLWTRISRWARERDGAERAEPAWVAAQDALGGYLNSKLPETVAPEVTESLHWWVVGRWLADGHWDGRGAALISCGAHERDELLDQLAYYGGGMYDTGTALQVRLLDPDGKLKDVLRRCGHGASSKHLPAEAFTLPGQVADALLAGYLSGDGHFREDRQRWMASSVSRELLLGIAMLAQRVHGAIASVFAGRPARDSEIQGRPVRCRQEWGLSFDIGERRTSPFVLDDGAWKKVRAIEDAGEVETWNLRVDEDESFTAEGCIVKNCPMQFDIVDRLIARYSNPGDVVFDPFAGIMTVPYCAVKLGRVGVGVELSPGYWRDGVAHVEGVARGLAAPTLFDAVDVDLEPTA